mmetsp:Transcript_89501/g.149475  ORF Transcript_89501/g.149475 Transcript_89501/m.149475 type:complete len:202 (+) Transcript_89501:40-645(+)
MGVVVSLRRQRRPFWVPSVVWEGGASQCVTLCVRVRPNIPVQGHLVTPPPLCPPGVNNWTVSRGKTDVHICAAGHARAHAHGPGYWSPWTNVPSFARLGGGGMPPCPRPCQSSHRGTAFGCDGGPVYLALFYPSGAGSMASQGCGGSRITGTARQGTVPQSQGGGIGLRCRPLFLHHPQGPVRCSLVRRVPCHGHSCLCKP